MKTTFAQALLLASTASVDAGKLCDVDISKFTKVRHVPAGISWHPSTDNLQGTDVYGSNKDDSKPWSVKYDLSAADSALIASGDMVNWIILNKEQIKSLQNKNHTNQTNGLGSAPKLSQLEMEHSSDQCGTHSVKYHNRNYAEDPWLSVKDFSKCYGGLGCTLYAENGIKDNYNSLKMHAGADVYLQMKESKQTLCGIDASKFTKVRHVPAGKKWHPATDNLQGTDVYGNQSDDSKPWSVPFDMKNTDMALIASGDMQNWIIMDREQIKSLFKPYAGYDYTKLNMLHSSDKCGTHSAKQINSSARPENPWLSVKDHLDCRKGNDCIVYSEASTTGNTESMTLHGGADVYIWSGSENSVKPYSFAGVGQANGQGYSRKWFSQYNLGLDACYELVKADSSCDKDYFSYYTRANKDCGCKTGGGALNVYEDGSKMIDYYKINDTNELTEMMGTRYPAATVGEFMKQAAELGDFVESHEDEMDKNFEKMMGFDEEDVEEWFEHSDRAEQYYKELEAWGNSPSVKAKQAHDMKMINSKKGQALVGAGMEVYNDIENKMEWRQGFTKKGDYEEWVSNDSVKNLLEDLYEVKQKLKALMETKMQAKNMELGWATLNDAHAQKLHSMILKDMGVKNCEQLQMKLMGLMMKVQDEMQDCPIVKQLEEKIIKMVMLVQSTKVEFDIPAERDVEAWINKNEFEPWV